MNTRESSCARYASLLNELCNCSAEAAPELLTQVAKEGCACGLGFHCVHYDLARRIEQGGPYTEDQIYGVVREAYGIKKLSHVGYVVKMAENTIRDMKKRWWFL